MTFLWPQITDPTARLRKGCATGAAAADFFVRPCRLPQTSGVLEETRSFFRAAAAFFRRRGLFSGGRAVLRKDRSDFLAAWPARRNPRRRKKSVAFRRRAFRTAGTSYILR